MRGRVFIAEDEDHDPYEGSFLLGTFSGHHDTGSSRPPSFSGLSAEAAIVWGRERSDVVLIRLGRGDYFNAGVHPDRDLPAWPPAGVDLRRRRPPKLAYLDRTDDDPPIPWRLELWLTPPGLVGPELDDEIDPAWPALVAAVADRLGAEWDDNELRGFVAELQRAARRARGGACGWSTDHAPVYRLRLMVEAPTLRAAEAAARSRLPELPGWRIDARATPRPG